jgi:hypothetical protein
MAERVPMEPSGCTRTARFQPPGPCPSRSRRTSTLATNTRCVNTERGRTPAVQQYSSPRTRTIARLDRRRVSNGRDDRPAGLSLADTVEERAIAMAPRGRSRRVPLANSRNAKRLGIADGDTIRVVSRRGGVVAPKSGHHAGGVHGPGLVKSAHRGRCPADLAPPSRAPTANACGSYREFITETLRNATAIW